ncbi:hypothetical protein [Pseudothermotoga thermarum]|uniref:Uncharacterized protein n=1 Tax=Pseudothermotoga thermarum DSM 5069 TaxID=688269 RepID=F7YTJ5_9THEM|nr:hypothetical protein [Pseudothermotoga thermarum]AEH51211.1 hypothetical protein Theth_1136 [Pseudothermotoga thermarum DSM 5069]
MKMPPEYIEAQKNMQPGVISSVGFLGNDERDLMEIITTDEQEMIALGLDFQKVAEWLKKMMKEAEKGLGEPVVLDKLEVQIFEARGFLPCPFKDGIFRKKTMYIKRLDKNLTLQVSELSIHLLEKHHFLQGKGSPFRIEPKILKELIE